MTNEIARSDALLRKLLPKGPWQVVEQGEANEWAILTPDGKWMISFRMNGEMMSTRQKVIAQLIAVAPNLLGLAYQYLSDLRHPPIGDSLQRRIDRAEAVIAKAEGRA